MVRKIIFILMFIVIGCKTNKSSMDYEDQNDKDYAAVIDMQDAENIFYSDLDEADFSHNNEYDKVIDSDLVAEHELMQDKDFYENITIDYESVVDADVQTSDAITLTVPADGGEYFIFDKHVLLIFPPGWARESAEITVRKADVADQYILESSIPRFDKKITLGIKRQRVVRSDGSVRYLAQIVEDKNYLLTNTISYEGYETAQTILPITFGLVVRAHITCNTGMTLIESEKVWWRGSLWTVEICMDPYEASLAPAGDVGNVDQSSQWPDGCEFDGTCGDTSTTAPQQAVEGVVPARNVSWYQAVVLCQHANKMLCPEVSWRVACEGAYGPNNYDELPCNYGAGGVGCYQYNSDMCHTKENYQSEKDTYEQKLYQCKKEFDYCKKSAPECQTDYDNCVAAAESWFNAFFYSGSFETCRSITGVWDMLGNLWEFVLFEDENDEVVRGVTRGGSYLDGEFSGDIGCKTKSEFGYVVSPDSTWDHIGFRCCTNYYREEYTVDEENDEDVLP